MGKWFKKNTNAENKATPIELMYTVEKALAGIDFKMRHVAMPEGFKASLGNLRNIFRKHEKESMELKSDRTTYNLSYKALPCKCHLGKEYVEKNKPVPDCAAKPDCKGTKKVRQVNNGDTIGKEIEAKRDDKWIQATIVEIANKEEVTVRFMDDDEKTSVAVDNTRVEEDICSVCNTTPWKGQVCELGWCKGTGNIPSNRVYLKDYQVVLQTNWNLQQAKRKAIVHDLYIRQKELKTKVERIDEILQQKVGQMNEINKIIQQKVTEAIVKIVEAQSNQIVAQSNAMPKKQTTIRNEALDYAKTLAQEIDEIGNNI